MSAGTSVESERKGDNSSVAFPTLLFCPEGSKSWIVNFRYFFDMHNPKIEKRYDHTPYKKYLTVYAPLSVKLFYSLIKWFMFVFFRIFDFVGYCHQKNTRSIFFDVI